MSWFYSFQKMHSYKLEVEVDSQPKSHQCWVHTRYVQGQGKGAQELL